MPFSHPPESPDAERIERRFRAFLDHSPAAAFILDENGIIRHLGETYFRTFKTVGPATIGSSVYDYAPREIADIWMANVRHVLASNQTLETIEPALRGDGTTGQFLVSKFPLPPHTPGEPRLVGGVCVDLTDRLAAESKLHATEQRFAFVAKSLNDGIWEWEPDSHKLFWSPRNFELLGYAPDEVVLTSDWFNQQLHPDDRDRLWHTVTQHLEGRTSEYHCEFRIRTKSGDYRWLSARGKAVRDENNRVSRMIGAQNDITDHKRAVIALAESREQLSLAVDGAGLGTFYCVFPLDKFVWNHTCKEHFFLPPDADVNLDLFFQRIHPDDRDLTRRAIERAQQLRETMNVHYRTVAPDGRQRWINAVGKFYYFPDGSPRRFDGITIDITEQKTAQLALRHSEERYRFLADNIPQIAWTASASGEVDSLNRRWYDYTGSAPLLPIPREELRNVVHPDDRDNALHTCAHALQTGEPCTVEYRLRRRDGAYRWFLAQTAPMHHPDGSIARWFGTCTDIDDFKRTQADNALLLRDTQQASDAKDRFLAVLSHELRTPLSPILMTLGALEKEPALPDHVDKDLALIRRNIDLETQLIDDLLDLTRISHGKILLTLRPTRLNPLLEHVCAVCTKEATARGLHLDCHFDAQPDTVLADPHRLEQVFLNLFKNALKFTPAGGSIHFASSNTPDGQLLVTLRDTGVGIEPDALSRIFDAFEQGEQTVTRNFGGLGLGLTIAQALIDLHHGRIWADSPGKSQGATFFVQFPLCTDAPAAPTPKPPAQASSTSAHRILLVDDHEDTLSVTARVLTSFGYRITPANSLHSALLALQNAPFDLLISDIGLPDGTGHLLLQHARKLHPNLPAIAISGFGMQSDIQKSLAAGFNAHLTKPISPDALSSLIASLT